eukprot:5342974-Amphidinium_carterae.1
MGMELALWRSDADRVRFGLEHFAMGQSAGESHGADLRTYTVSHHIESHICGNDGSRKYHSNKFATNRSTLLLHQLEGGAFSESQRVTMTIIQIESHGHAHRCGQTFLEDVRIVVGLVTDKQCSERHPLLNCHCSSVGHRRRTSHCTVRGVRSLFLSAGDDTPSLIELLARLSASGVKGPLQEIHASLPWWPAQHDFIKVRASSVTRIIRVSFADLLHGCRWLWVGVPTALAVEVRAAIVETTVLSDVRMAD